MPFFLTTVEVHRTVIIPPDAVDPLHPSKVLNLVLWIAQLVLAVVFSLAGAMKLFTPMAELAHALPWTAAAAPALVRFIGLSELAGAVGLLLPSLTRVLPVLTPLAASCLMLVMLLAAAFHATRGELAALPISIILASLAAVVAWGRAVKAPIPPRD